MEEIIQVDNNQQLPPLPASDPESMARNKFDGYYNVTARDYWRHADVNLNKINDLQKCDHYFKQQGYRSQCAKCHIGFFGPSIRAMDGKLFINNVETVF